MGIFNKQQSTKKSAGSGDPLDDQNFFDDYFREELRNRGRWHFERVISENAELFKQDLDATISHLHDDLKTRIVKEVETAVAQVNVDVKDQVTNQLNTQLEEYRKTLDDTKKAAVEALNHGKKVLEDQQHELTRAMQQTIQEQESSLQTVFEQSKSRMTQMSESQQSALEWLDTSMQELKKQQERLTQDLERNVAKQQELMTNAFHDNMAQVVEHYLLGAVSDQYDMKSQLPGILQHLEENKQAMTDDMKL